MNEARLTSIQMTNSYKHCSMTPKQSPQASDFQVTFLLKGQKRKTTRFILLRGEFKLPYSALKPEHLLHEYFSLHFEVFMWINVDDNGN